MAYASAVEPLRAANRLSGRTLYRWVNIGVEERSAASSSGLQLYADHRVGEPAEFDLVLVCAGGDPSRFHHPPTLRWLQGLARAGVRLGGISAGPYILAQSGVLDGYRCTLHWEHVPAFREAFPEIDLRSSVFEIDRGRLTCAGGTAALDLMHRLIAADHGAALAADVDEWFLHTHPRESTGQQRMTPRERYGIASAPLLGALVAIEQQTETPPSRLELARTAGVSTRQLDRLAAHHLGRSLGTQSRQVRLERARILLRQSSLPVTEIGLACGFASPSHFSRTFKARYGHPPRHERMIKPN